MMGTKALKKHWKQKGGVFVLTALALPFFLACVGLAIDVGNLYIHKSRLQNAADAAALAGGREFANQGETVASHPNADTEAQSYTNLDMATLGGGALTDQRYKAQQVDEDTILYGVRLTETVPLYFMRIFGMTDTPVVADAAVAIGLVGGGNGRDLFIFRHYLKGVNTIENPDDDAIINKRKPGTIVTTFDGDIAFTDGSGKNPNNQDGYNYDYVDFSTQRKELRYFFTERARTEGLGVMDAIERGRDYAFQEIYEDYDMDELGRATRERLGLDKYGESPGTVDWRDWQPLYSLQWGSPEYKQLEADLTARQNAYNDWVQKTNALYANQENLNESSFSHDVAFSAIQKQDITVNFNNAVPGGADADPVYVYVDKSISLVNLTLNADTERPLIIVYEGSGQFHLEMQGHTFRGVVYAPNVNEQEGVLINANGGTFSGTIIANALNLQGGKGTYKYENFGIGGGSGGTKKVSGSSTVRLAPTDGMDWT